MPTNLFFRQYDLECLSLYSYLIGDTTTGRAVVVDPQRDISRYLVDAEAHGLTIERVLETHFHADFLSGHLELAEATGAVISYAEPAAPDFPIDPLAHGQRLSLGQVTLEIRHTPGHTPESMSIVVHPTPSGGPWAVLTGDTLFIGDVGRPDLMTSVGRTAESLARDLYRSLHEQLLTLPDETLVYPAHGAGSACGKQLSTAASSTIGEQRTTNYALAPMTVASFVDAVTDGLGSPPRHFAFAADANKRQRDLLDDLHPPRELTIDEALALASEGAVILDTRSADSFAARHLRGSISVGLEGRFAEHSGDVVRPGQPVVLVGDAGRGAEAKVRLARIGIDTVAGEVPDLEAVLATRPDLARTVGRLTATELVGWLREDVAVQVVDVRGSGETRVGGTVPGAQNIPLPELLDHLGDLDPSRTTVVYCAGGYRSSIAASTLRAHGFSDVVDVVGGYGAWLAATTAGRSDPGT